ncbi:MAG: c(7)-type cytochrome triheme domain-containing protein [Candidatus Thiodiazotropha sp.]
MSSCHIIFVFFLVISLATPAFAVDISPVGKVKVGDLAVGQKTADSSEPRAEQQKDKRKSVTGDDSVTEKDNASQKKKIVNEGEKAAANKKDQSSNSLNKQMKPGKKLAYNPSPNSFNRLMKPPSKRNPPPAKDGIHDPDNDGTHILQAPRDSFSQLTKSNSGNRVDWVAAIEKGEINPRYDRLDPKKLPIILDLNIVREVKGSMPDVVYPHKQHTEWLDCSNCHPAIFVPMKGANSISMASILLGEKCGVCHGKVAFPVSECRKCHSKNKTE